MIEQFINARKNSTLSHETDLTDLKRTREDMLQAIERFKKFQKNCESSFLESVKAIEAQISILEKHQTENQKLTDIVLVDVRKVFEAAIVKLQTFCEL